MRLSTDESRDEERAGATIAAAVEAGITVFDTARAYGRGEPELGHNERLLASALRLCGAERRARVVTKGGMTRAGGAWVPDGRAKAIVGDCAASLDALDGVPIDLYLLHAPDPRAPWSTSVRALTRLVDDGAVRRVGLSNVNRRQLDEALELAPVAAVEVALSPYDDHALRGGILARCTERGIAVIAHSPLGPAHAGVFVAAAALEHPGWEHALDGGDRTGPHLVLDWRGDGVPDTLEQCVERLGAAVSGPVEGALCPHGGGPPSCWCRAPLPGLPLAFARAHDVDPTRSILIGTATAHRTLAAALRARYVPAAPPVP